MALAVYQAQAQDAFGNVLVSPTIEVRDEADDSLVEIFATDDEDDDPIANPFTGDIDGFFRFYVDAGFYRITVTKDAAEREFRHVAIGTAAGTEAGREILDAARTYYVRADLGIVTMTIASPAVATKSTHGLAENDRVAFSIIRNMAAATVTIASPGVFTRTGHGYSNNDPVRLRTTGALPTGLTAGTTYFARNVAANTFELSLTSGGASINTSGSQSGTHYVERTGTFATGVTEGTTYYVLATDLTANTFKFSASEGGAAVNTSGSQAGVFNLAAGHDDHNGLAQTAADAKFTIAAAYNAVKRIDGNGNTVTIQLADGTYTETNLQFIGLLVGITTLEMYGDTATPSNVFFDMASAALTVQQGAQMQMGGFRIRTTGHAIYLDSQGSLLVSQPIELDDTTLDQLSANKGSLLSVTANYKILGDCGGANWGIYQGSQARIADRTIDILDAPSTNTFAVVQQAAAIACNANTFNGSMTGPRFNVSANGVIQTFGTDPATYLPGNSAGSSSTGGQYI